MIVINLKPKSLLIFCCKQPAVVLQYFNKPQSEQNIGVVKIQMDCFLDALASLDFKLSLAQWFTFFRFSVNLKVVTEEIQVLDVIHVIQVI